MGRNNRSGRGSGRGGRGAGHGGRGTGQPPKEKKTLAENKFYVGAVTQASDFIVVKKFLINYIQKTFPYGDDIGEALLRDRQPDMRKWFPEQMESDETDQVKADKENKRLEWLYKEELKEYQTRKTTYERNKKKAYSFLIGQCAKNMQLSLIHI